MPFLRHATPIMNLGSILRLGLLPSRSKGKRQEVWFHTPSWSSWCVLHCSRRHGVSPEQIVVIEVSVPAGRLTRRGRGKWSTTDAIRVSRECRILTHNLACCLYDSDGPKRKKR